VKSTPRGDDTADRLYGALFDKDGDARACADISEDACFEVPRNFFIHLFSQIATKTGDALSSPRLVLSWLLAGLGVSPGIIGLIVPVREAGSLLPQLAIGSFVRRSPVRKWFWVAGSVAQGLTVAGIAVVALLLRGAAAGWTIVALIALFSVARGLCSVTGKDLVGKTIPKRRRGRLSGLSASVAGAVTVLFGGALALVGPDHLPVYVFALFVAAAGALWLVAAGTMARLYEQPGPTEHGGNALRMALASLRLLRRDRMFARFVTARALLASTVLSMPFYVLLARDATGDRAATLGLFIIASSLATAISGYTWGKLADRSSRKTLVIAGAAASAVGVVAYALGTQTGGAPAAGTASWIYAVLFFVLSLAHTGIRVGRKTYLVDMASAEERASYVAVANTVIGVVLLLSGSLGVLATFLSSYEVILVFALLGLAGAAVALTLDEVEQAHDPTR
jgi:MFS family permease